MPSSRKRIAVINDDSVVLDLFEQVLGQGADREVHVRRHWDGAFEFVIEYKPDVVVLDLVPGSEEQGWQLIESLRQEPAFAATPVIVATSANLTLGEQVEQIDRLNVSVLMKPFLMDDLVARTDLALGSTEDGED